jgi:hypothetical protein
MNKELKGLRFLTDIHIWFCVVFYPFIGIIICMVQMCDKWLWKDSNACLGKAFVV